MTNSIHDKLHLTLNPQHTETTDILKQLTQAATTRQQTRTKLLRNMQHEQIKHNTAHKIKQLFKPGTRAIQKAMGKPTVSTTMQTLATTHPDTIALLLHSSMRTTQLAMLNTFCQDNNIRHTTRDYNGFVWITTHQHAQLLTLIRQCQLHKIHIVNITQYDTTHLKTRAPETTQSKDIDS